MTKKQQDTPPKKVQQDTPPPKTFFGSTEFMNAVAERKARLKEATKYQEEGVYNENLLRGRDWN